MSEKYTKGPWQLSAPEDRYDTWLILCSAPHEVVHIAPRFKSGERDKEQEEANARRIVACVNVCEGMSTEVLESITVLESAQRCEQLRALRAEQSKKFKEEQERKAA